MESRFTNNKYRPEVGSNRPGGRSAPVTYTHNADLDGLRDDLERLLSEISKLEAYLEDELDGLSLKVNYEDKKLVESHMAEWPSDLGDPVDQVSYRYYKALRLRDTTAASYIRKRYEEAARDVTGTTAIDFLSLASMMKQEALLIQEFLNVRVGLVDDSSEHRVLEIFQDWVQSGLRYAREFWAFLEQRPETEELLPPEEIGRATPEEAKQGQAVFKVKLNSHNDAIVKDTDFLKKNFSEFAPVFYTNFLGPALTYRLNVGRRPSVSSSVLAREIDSASEALHTHMTHALADQLRRRELFEVKVDKIFDNIKRRDVYRSYIRQLSDVGKSLPVAGDRVMVPTHEEVAAQVEYFVREEEEYEEDDSPGTFIASHKDLLDRDADDAHAQYLLRAGGTITGDVDFESGVRIDGIVPSTHRHTGKDGSAQIHGSDIIGGSLGDDVVDTGRKPPVPTDLRVIEHRVRVIPPGVSVVNTTIGWTGHQRYTYEVQRVTL